MALLQQTSLFSSANLIAYYKCEDNGNDEKGSYNLTVSSLTYPSGKYGKAFDCSSNEAKATSTSSYAIGSTAFTVAFWAKLVSSTNNTALWFSMSNSTNDIAVDIKYEYNGGSPRIFWKRSRNGISTPDMTYSWTPTADKYYHVAMTYDGSSIYGFLNGAQVATETTSGSGNDGSSDFIEICRNAGGLETAMDDIAVFNTNLSETQIKTLYLDTSPMFIFNFV